MIEVLRIGDETRIMNPVTGEWQDMVNMVFIERGRDSANKAMSDTSNFLSELVGDEVGLENIRVHTHPVRRDKVDKFPVGSTHEGHINREMWSMPQMQQQIGREPRIVNGKITYFTTKLGATPEPDADYRTEIQTQVHLPAELLERARVGATQVQVTKRNPAPVRPSVPGSVENTEPVRQ